MSHRSLSLLAAAGLILCAPIFITPAHAANSPMTDRQVAREDGDVGNNPHDLVQGAHVEGHIAFLKTELGITQAQEALWAPVAAAMREDVRRLHQADMEANRNQGPENAIDYLHNRVHFADLRAEGEERFLTAFEPLYNSLSAQQKLAADELLIPSDPQ